MDNGVFKHSFKIAYQESTGLAVYNCGFQKCEPAHSWGPAVRDHYLIHYVSSGKGRFSNGSVNYELSAGDLFLIVPSKIVSYCADEEEPWEYYWVGFNGTDAERLVRMTGVSEVNPILHYPDNDKIKKAILKIYEAKGSTVRDETRMIGRLYLFLSLLMECAGAEDETSSGGFEYIEKSLRYIQYNYSREINVDDIAASAGLSRSHLYRMFVKHLSMPPNEFVSRFRINQACMLLREQHLSVCEAAYSCGFNDQLYFSRIFKKYKGVPPSKYVKQYQNKRTVEENLGDMTYNLKTPDENTSGGIDDDDI